MRGAVSRAGDSVLYTERRCSHQADVWRLCRPSSFTEVICDKVNFSNTHELLLQTAFQEAEETLQELLTKVQSDPKLREDAARGVIRGPQLAQVEFELRKLAHDKQRHTGLQEKGQQGEEVAVERQDGSTTAGHCEQPKGEPEGQGVQAERQEGTKALAESVLTYYRQLGHMLSCAVDLR